LIALLLSFSTKTLSLFLVLLSRTLMVLHDKYSPNISASMHFSSALKAIGLTHQIFFKEKAMHLFTALTQSSLQILYNLFVDEQISLTLVGYSTDINLREQRLLQLYFFSSFQRI